MTVRTLVDCEAVVIGASAGGVEALMTLLPALQAGSRFAVLVVMHVPRGHPSALVEIYTPRCTFTVLEAEDKEPIEPGHLYFAPPDYHLLVDRDADGKSILALSADDLVNYSRPSIDVLFESAADHFGRRLAGIVLTGANSDGAAGLAAIGRAGGVTIVQDPATAFSAPMPAAALARGEIDHVLPLDGIAALLRGAKSD
jgi:two-component system, chemotaxis family, protein-glutamate methylesterase/glutaminase